MKTKCNHYILVTDWEKVDKDDFYLSRDYENVEGIEYVRKARRAQKRGNLFEAYIVDALSYAIFEQMDSNKVFINKNGDVILNCETAIIGRDHQYREKYNY